MLHSRKPRRENHHRESTRPSVRRRVVVNYQKHFNIDILINPEALTAVELAKHVRNPERMALEDFARGAIELQEVEISPDSKAAGTSLRDLPLSGVKIGYVEREGELIVPRAETVLRAGDKATIIGTPDNILKDRRVFSSASPIAQRIVLYGATETAISVIRRLRDHRFKIRVIEPDLENAKRSPKPSQTSQS